MSAITTRILRTTAAAFLAVGALGLAHSVTADTSTKPHHAVVADSAPLTPDQTLLLTDPHGDQNADDVTWGH
ncbi:hypothetical protein ACFYUJ_32730 [Streptomyces sp. NPDC004520]|uniref:hypothetical protein n=1 Tax=Streptomyces sp. NPDC004520 TaxID=3364702 RepID=UPI0036934637